MARATWDILLQTERIEEALAYRVSNPLGVIYEIAEGALV